MNLMAAFLNFSQITEISAEFALQESVQGS